MMEIRNIAIIAHVDHGKTTLTDSLMRQTGMVEEGVTMDSNALELERGITIYSKNASLFYKGTKINIVDTPGHSDFGSEVERVLRSIDTVLLIVDAQEGPMPQTRFVLKKSLELGLKPIVVINKIDKPAARPDWVHEAVLELFLELGANNEQIEFPTVYAIGREGIAKKNLTDKSSDLTSLLDTVLEHVPSSTKVTKGKAALLQPFNLAYDNFLGRLAIARIYEGVLKTGENVWVKKPTGEEYKGKITKLFTFEGTKRVESQEVVAGDICMIAGLSEIYIGDTVSGTENFEALPAINVDEPTISLNFLVNNSPFAGREGKFVTGRQIRERLERELEVNVGLKVDFSTSDYYTVYGRGELHIAILCENMRREGFELQVSQPKVIVKEEKGEKTEPFEEVLVDVPEEMSGSIISALTVRKAQLMDMKTENNQTRLTFEVPTRGLLGYRGEFVVVTKGLGILSSRFIGFRKYVGEIDHHNVGAMISMEAGKCLAFSLDNLQQRGVLYVGPSAEVYAGQVIGNSSKGEDLYVNPTKGKQLTNMRASGSDEGIFLVPAWKLSIERAMEVMNDDEYIEITPSSIRLRKIYLTQQERSKAQRKSSVLKVRF
ncbi:MAG: GTP-binding protein TypA [Candidatus Zambryskibacteria bacterium RIFCSPHIGHO2_02_FULL_43_14]|uniref:50S ribosomal subunit assembly factor BipA n=1 Tax=Candidatus Zambryskibacteria bacterium RIFCSPHIGHO2_02_FULL_43_14 TaxID=1802748 RepID=A0A1G2TFM1_9BACT|nr:MAG: GTP-binding protein TypA [Candidatus Zambryskibacteria bacterium RIFCSPHIGHO2_01_FULL_43_60]OHA96077.1 MAG: GTP-binding protein TypA [Candidatus Zambryskibacteria bacterium RIFCSPHIGHO2_02_FULL_43_14]OHB02844.1 MAG: GTP-binding protein TypA [Candidatus Zambryskibacteria bacterium RIFCSPLOWO2_01_FULL_42_41]